MSSASSSSSTVSDPNSRPIPLNGQRVPEGMTDHADWKNLPEQEVVTVPSETYGSEYVKIEARRNALGDLKKSISALLLPLSALYKNKALLSSVSADSEADRAKTIQEFIAKDEAQKQAALISLKSHEKTFEADSQYSEVIRKLVTDAERELSQTEWNKLNEWIKIQTTTIFREQGNLLQELKKIKKQHAAKQKEEKKE